MENQDVYSPKGFGEHLAFAASKKLLWLERKLPSLFSSGEDNEIDIYASSMSAEFNWLHKLIYPRFFEKINVESEHLDQIREISKTSTIVYVTRDIGQLEYNFFNYLFNEEMLPKSKFVNELSLWQWLPTKEMLAILAERARRFVSYGPLPHPVSSGYLGAIIDRGNSVFLQIKLTELFNDLFWYTPNEDVLAALLAAQERSPRPVTIVPLYFLWNKRPDGQPYSIVNILPSFIKRTVRFLRNCKNKAVVKVGQPIELEKFIAPYADNPLSERAAKLRSAFLDILLQEKKVVTGPAIKPRGYMIHELLEDESLGKTIYNISLARGTPVDDLKALAKKYAGEIAADINYHYIEIGFRLMNWALKNVYDGISIDSEGLAKLKRAAAKAPVVLIPNHRSHMDYLLLTTILYSNNVSIPHVAAGINLSFWPMGHIFRRCGAFFLRRSFSGNELYRAVFKSYLKLLLREGFIQEFFIEGGRSRTGKLRRPRLGMMTMLSEALNEESRDAQNPKEAYFVPVAITYDRLMEEYSGEVEGGSKQKERTRDLLHITKYLRRRYGRIYVRFGEPIAYQPKQTATETAEELAGEVMRSIGSNLVVTPNSLTAISLLVSPKRAVSRGDLLENAEVLAAYLRSANATFSEAFNENTLEQIISDSIAGFERERLIETHREFSPVCYEIMEKGRQRLNYYKNNIIHFTLAASFAASALISAGRKGLQHASRGDVVEKCMTLSEIFLREFQAGVGRISRADIEKALAYFEERGIYSSMHHLGIFKGITANFIESYLIAISACKNMEPADEKGLQRQMIKLGRHMLLLGKIERIEAISNPVFNHAIEMWVRFGILKAEESEKRKKTYIWNDRSDLCDKLKQTLEGLT